MSAARVAIEADVARTTIYRHWPDSASLLLATINDIATPSYPTVDTSDFEADLRSTLNSLCVRLVTKQTRKVFSALSSQAYHSDTFATAQRNFIDRLTQPVEEVLVAAKARGDLSASCDVVRRTHRRVR